MNTTQQPQQENSEPKTNQLSSQDKLLALGCYAPAISFAVCLYGLLKKADDEFIMFHVRQGVALFVISFVWVFIIALVPVVGELLWVTITVAGIWGMVTGYQGKKVNIPVLEALGEIFPIEKIYQHFTGKPFPKNNEEKRGNPLPPTQIPLPPEQNPENQMQQNPTNTSTESTQQPIPPPEQPAQQLPKPQQPPTENSASSTLEATSPDKSHQPPQQS